MDVRRRCNRANLVREVDFCQPDIVVLIETQLRTEDVPNEFRALGYLFVLHLFFLESDLVFQYEDKLAVHPRMDLVNVLAFSFKDGGVRWINAYFKSDHKL